MYNISGFIIALNEEERIRTAILSIKPLVNELFVIDSGSSDNTVKIAEELGAKVVYNKWEGYVEQKIFGENLCKNDWIINIDADEELSSDLQDEISYIFNIGLQEKYWGYRIKLVIQHNVKSIFPISMFPRNNVIRLYNRKYYGFNNISDNTTTHDAVELVKSLSVTKSEIKNKIYNLEHIAYHRSNISIDQTMNKINFFSTAQMHDMVTLKRNCSKMRMIFELPFNSFKFFILRRYFVFGLYGFIYSMMFAFSRFIRIAKLYEYYNEENSNKTNNIDKNH